MKVKNRKKCSY